ncbi:LOW QUALITY PROTEIN: uncharacterized protein RCH25_015998 [Pelodytes ibericus]
MAGPFRDPPVANLRVSPLGVVPKKEPGKYRLIHHLSYPAGDDDIDKDLCSVSYSSFDQAVELVVSVEDLELFTDAAGSTGFGAYFGGRWCAARWPDCLVFGSHYPLFAGEASPATLDESMVAMAFWFKVRGWEDVTKHFLVKQEVKGLVAWIIGHSFVFWAKRAAARPLGFYRAHLEVKWFGYRGYGWGDVFTKLIHLLNRGRRPDVVIFHAGGNNLGLVPQRVLVCTMKQVINRLRDWLPGVAVVWSEIVPRFQWRHARDQVALGKSRIKIKRLMSAFVRRVGGVVVRHRELEAQLPEYYRADGIHLSDVSLNFLNMGFQAGLERALFMAEPSQLMVSRTWFVAGV